MNDDDNFSLVRGSVYRFTSAGAGELAVVTEGVFLGYVPFGDESAVSVRISEGELAGRIRLIPCNTIFFVDVIKQEREEKKKPKEEKVNFYS